MILSMRCDNDVPVPVEAVGNLLLGEEGDFSLRFIGLGRFHCMLWIKGEREKLCCDVARVCGRERFLVF